ncbi:MAG: BrnT family toxin [Phycisphaerales bacterium]
MSLTFEWDARKAKTNRRKHGVSFGEAAGVFGDARSLTIHDSAHSQREDRYVTLGLSQNGRLWVVVHTERGDTIRIISARKATVNEQRTYASND